MDSPEGATGGKKSFYDFKSVSENWFPRRGNWREETLLLFQVGFLKMDSPKGQLEGRHNFDSVK